MSKSLRYKKENYEYFLEVTDEEYAEIEEHREAIRKEKRALADKLSLFEKLCPSRVHKKPHTIDVSAILDV